MEKVKTDLINCLCALTQAGSQKYEGREWYAAHHEGHNHHEQSVGNLCLVAHTNGVFPAKNFLLVQMKL
jgi:hypothetical protein